MLRDSWRKGQVGWRGSRLLPFFKAFVSLLVLACFFLCCSCNQSRIPVGSDSFFIKGSLQKHSSKPPAYDNLLNPASPSSLQSSDKALKAELGGKPRSKTSLDNTSYWEEQHPEIAALMSASKNAQEAEPHFRMAEYYMGYQIFDKAYEEYWKAIELDSSNDAYWDGVGRLCREWGHPQLGIAILQQVLQRNPQSATTWNTLGTLHDKLGDHEQARQCYLKALELNPDLDFVQSNLCYNCLQEGKLEQAIAYGEAAVRLTPNFEVAQNNLGIAYALAGNLDKALEHFKLAGDEAGAYNNLGLFLLKRQRYDEAMENFKRAAKLKPFSKIASENYYYAWNLKAEQTRARKRDLLERMKTPSFTEEIFIALQTIMNSPFHTQPALDYVPQEMGTAGTLAKVAARVDSPVANQTVPFAGTRLDITSPVDLQWAAKTLSEFLQRKCEIIARVLAQPAPLAPRTTVYYKPGLATTAVRLAHQIPGDQDVYQARALKASFDIQIVVGQDLLPFLSAEEKRAKPSSVPAPGSRTTLTALSSPPRSLKF